MTKEDITKAVEHETNRTCIRVVPFVYTFDANVANTYRIGKFLESNKVLVYAEISSTTVDVVSVGGKVFYGGNITAVSNSISNQPLKVLLQSGFAITPANAGLMTVKGYYFYLTSIIQPTEFTQDYEIE